MKRLCLIALLSTSLCACQATSSLPRSTTVATSSISSHTLNLRTQGQAVADDCSETEPLFYQKGGKVGLPSADGNFYGKIYYPSGSFGEGQSFLEVCPGFDNAFGTPVPKGHTPDWFGQMSFEFSAVFGQADLDGKMYSTSWLPRTDYFMYLYDGNNNLIESYKMGRANAKSGVLFFPSPFENGLTVTEGTALNLEIVHKTK